MLLGIFRTPKRVPRPACPSPTMTLGGAHPMEEFLKKILSKAAFAKATELVLSQPAATTPAQATANHEAVVAGLIAFIEDLDDKVELIPHVGPFLRMFVDLPQVDAYERQFAAYVVETVYRSLKYADALEGGK